MTAKWLDDARRVLVLDLAAELGLDLGGDRKSFGPLPWLRRSDQGQRQARAVQGAARRQRLEML